LTLKSNLFTQLNQVQVSLAKSPTKPLAKLYYEQLNEFFILIGDERGEESEAAQQINEFLLYPLLSALKRAQFNAEHISEWSDLNEFLLKCINLVLTRVNFDLTQKNLFFDFLNLLCILLSSKKQQLSASVKSISDELLIECFRSLSIVFHEPAWSQAYNVFFSFEHMTTMGLLVSVLLDTLIQSNSLSVRLEVLQAFKSLTFYDSNEEDEWNLRLASDFQRRIGILFASFLPGFSIKLVQGFMLNENLKLMNHKLICSSLQLFAHVLANVFNDSLLNSAYFGKHYKQCGEFNASEKQKRDLSQMAVNRLEENSSWLSTTAEKLFILIDRLIDVLMKLDNPHVNLALVNFCATIVQCCYVTLNRYMSNLLKVLVTYAANSANQLFVQQAAEKSLRNLVDKSAKSIESNSETMKTNEIVTRFSLINACVEELLVRLPSLVHKSRNTTQLDDAQRQTQLRVLFGYLKFIGDLESSAGNEPMNLKEFFQSNSNNLHQLLETLLSCVQFDLNTLENFYNIQLNNDAVTSESISKLSNYSEDLKFYLSDKSIYEQLVTLCEYLGSSNAARLLIDQLITSDVHWTQRKLESMFILNLFMRGLSRRPSQSDCAELDSIVNLVLTTFMSQHKEELDQSGKIGLNDELEELAIGDREHSRVESSTMRKNRQIIQTCLKIESISTASRCLNASNFNVYLIDTLYYTLENYLHSNVLIRSVSTRCLNDLATCLKYTSIQHLLSSNYDYIMNDLIIKSTRNYQRFQAMRRQHEQSVQYSHVYVLCSLLQICDADLIPYLERLIDDYLMALEMRYAPNEAVAYQLVLGICKIIGYMCGSMQTRWHPIKFNFLDNLDQTDPTSGENEFFHLNLRKVVEAKQNKESFSSFLDTINVIEANLIRFREEQDSKINETIKNDEIEESFPTEKGESLDESEAFKEENDEKQKEVPLHVKIQCKCLTLCTHLLAHPVKRIRLKVIELIGELCKNLVEHTNELLPLVHKLWQPICQRFTFDDFVVKQKVVNLLLDLSVLCGDFIGSRVHKEFIPRLCSFMIEQANQSLKHSKTNMNSTNEIPNETYVYSHAFKLQCSILSNVDKMSVLLELKGVELEQIIDSVVLRYLDKRQPKKLQFLATEALKNCSLIDSDVVWLCLHYILQFSSIKYDEQSSDFEYSTFIKTKYPNMQLDKDVQNELFKIFISI